jgi:WD40 repeat protein
MSLAVASGHDIVVLNLNDSHRRVFSGHTDDVICLARSLDGTLMVSGSQDTTVRLWDTKTMECVRVFSGHSSVVDSVSLSNDGSMIVSASEDRSMRLWSVSTGECTHVYREVRNESGFYPEFILCKHVEFLPDNEHFVSGIFSNEEFLIVWSTKSYKKTKNITARINCLDNMKLSKDGIHVVTTSYDKYVRLWNLNTLECVGLTEGSISSMLTVDIHENPLIVIWADFCAGVQVWNVDNDERRIIEGTKKVTHVLLTDTGNTAVASWESLRIFDSEHKEVWIESLDSPCVAMINLP